MLPLYVHRRSPVHALPAGVKILAVLAGSAVIFLTASTAGQAGLALAIGGLYGLARLPLRDVIGALRPILLLAALVFALQLVIAGPPEAVRAVLRILSLVLLASLVTLTTPLSAMIEVLTRAAGPLRGVGLKPPQLALAIALTIRFIPVLLQDFQEIQAARAARGARGPGVLAVGPLLIKTLRMTATLSDAIAARGFESRR